MESCISPGVLVASSIWRASQSRPESLRSHAKPTVTVMATTASRPARPSSPHVARSEEHTSELQSLMRISYAVFCLKKKKARTLVRTSFIDHQDKHECDN